MTKYLFFPMVLAGPALISMGIYPPQLATPIEALFFWVLVLTLPAWLLGVWVDSNRAGLTPSLTFWIGVAAMTIGLTTYVAMAMAYDDGPLRKASDITCGVIGFAGMCLTLDHVKALDRKAKALKSERP